MEFPLSIIMPIPTHPDFFKTSILVIHTVLDMNNLHFSDEFLDFPVQVDADIHEDVFGFSARFCCDFSHDSAW